MNKFLIIGIHDSTQNYSMSVLFNSKIYSIELERLIGIKTGLYKHKNNNHFFEQYELNQYTYIEKDTLTLGEYGIYLMFKYFSNYLGFDKNDIDLIVTSSGNQYRNIFGDKKNVLPTSHHKMHAYSTYFLSGFKKSNILVIDGAGYDLESKKVELQSMYFGDGKIIKHFKTDFALENKNISIGIAYERVAGFLGLTEGKLMGLSGFGQNYRKYHFFELKNGGVYLKKDLHEVFCNKQLFFKHFGLLEEFDKNGYLSEKIVNFAASFQKEVEQAILYLANYLYEQNPCENLSYSGGVALNCLTNSRIKNELKYKNIFVQPAAGDSGISLGNLFYGYYDFLNLKGKISLFSDNYGLGIDYKENILEKLNKYSDYLDFKYIPRDSDLIGKLSQKIIDKKINIIFRGGSEFGPRALGNRSIISSINIENIQYKINKIKDREYWRPFGMMILDAQNKKYFENPVDSKFMLFTGNLKQESINIFKNIAHNDGTIRLQTISRKNGFYYELLSKLNKNNIKGLLNTSLNGKSEAILETPKQAIEFFLLKDGIDYLFLDNYIISKKTNSKFTSKKLSNMTLIETVITNIKMLLIKKSLYKFENVFIDLDIFRKSISVNIILENKLLGQLAFIYKNDNYILNDEINKHNLDLNVLVSNITDNTELLNKLFGMVRGIFIADSL